MNSSELSLRLKQVAECVPFNSRVADVGSDHAYLLLYLAKFKRISFGIAGEINTGPFNLALKNISASRLGNILEVRLGNGLEVITSDDTIDVVTICGMGGVLIKKILNEAISQNFFMRIQYFVLQPNSGEKELRTWLNLNHFTILNEFIVEDSEVLYEILLVSYTPKEIQNLEKKELFFGPILLTKKTDLFRKKWLAELTHRIEIEKSIKQSKSLNNKKISKFSAEIKMIEEVLNN